MKKVLLSTGPAAPARVACLPSWLWMQKSEQPSPFLRFLSYRLDRMGWGNLLLTGYVYLIKFLVEINSLKFYLLQTLREKCKHFDIFKELVWKIVLCIRAEIQGLVNFISVKNLTFFHGLVLYHVQFVFSFLNTITKGHF